MNGYRTMRLKAYCKSSGFSLVEMAIVLVIVALLLGGLLPTISSQVEQQRRNETRKQMDEIISALLGYAASQQPPKLPCPAKPAIATGLANAGISDCTISSGVVPWATLGTSETDAWGRRFTYSVASIYTTSFTLSSTGNLNVLTAAGGNAIASGVPAVIVSHGTNGMGAYTPQGIQIGYASASPDEKENVDGTPFVSHDFVQNGFDDLVTWLSPNTLNNRMVAAGKLP